MLEDLEAANAEYAARFDLAGLEAPARRGLAVVTCMDTRVDPLPVLGLAPGDAKIIRNAGGRVTDDVVRSLILAVSFLGVREVLVMHHTRCALAGRSEADVAASLPADRRPADPDRRWLAMDDPDAALAADVATVTGEAALSGVAVEGWRYDVDTGRVARVVTAG